MKGRKWYQQFKSIQSSMTFAFFMLTVIVVLISISLTFYFVKESARESAESYTSEIVKQMSYNIEYYTREMESVTKTLGTNYDALRYFEQDSYLPSVQEEQIHERILGLLESLLDSRKDINAASLFGYDKSVISYKNKPINNEADIANSDWFKGAVGQSGKIYITGSYVQNIYEGAYPWVVSMSREMVDTITKEPRGVVVIDMNYSIINDICNQVTLGDHGYVYILDKYGSVVWHPKQQLVHTGLYNELLKEIINVEDGSFSETVDGNDRMYTVITSKSTGWRIVGVTDEKEMVRNMDQIGIVFIIVGLASILGSYFIARIISITLSRPIKNLKKSMIEVQNGNLEGAVEIDNRNEIGDLSHTFNEMTHEIRHLIEENNKEQKLKRKSEIKALQAQINPHFLYNTLDSIIWMSLEDKKEEVVEMTSALAKLFRLSINKGDELITIAGEVEHVRNYLKIQKFRYDEKLTYAIHLDPTVKDLKIQKLILQPVVENALYHGIKNKLDGGHIDVIIYKEEGYLKMQVKDNGIGMDAGTLESVRKLQVKSQSGVGTKNVVERIKLVYGGEAEVTFDSELDVGTTVTIAIPIELMEVMTFES